ncbi:hypothetical protein EDD22DRAFT_1052690 [Suillus occidentalis]|nr:hypothetical protein EDD22DRAFT_1052690 [Suillus occidentalis]
MCLQGNYTGPALVLCNLTSFENKGFKWEELKLLRCKMGFFYTFWEARLLSMIQHWIVLQIQMSKWHESSHGLVRKPGHLNKNTVETENPARWGLDDAIATPAQANTFVQHSVHYHAWQCDKCIKLNKACIVLPDKKSTARLAPPKPTTHASSHVKWMAVVSASLNDSQIGQGVMDGVSDSMVAQGSNAMQAVEAFQLPAPTPAQPPTLAQGQCNNPLSRSTRVAPSIGLDLPGNQLTTHDIYDSIHDLGRRFDLLATNEYVDELDSWLGMVEDRFDWRLNALEAQITASDANWRGTSSSIAHLMLTLQAHTGNPNAHQPILANAMHQPPHPMMSSWHLEDVASSSRPGTSTARRSFMHSHNMSLPMGVGNGAGPSTALVLLVKFTNVAELHDHSDEPSQLSSSPSSSVYDL